MHRRRAGLRTGPAKPGLDHLLDALRAPATAAETGGEQAMVAALAAERRRVVRADRPARRARASFRTVFVSVTATVALLSATGTAVAARTGSLPAGAQQHAHRLFSGLGVPAPRTGGISGTTGPIQSASVSGGPSPSHTPSPSPSSSHKPPASASPSPSASDSASAPVDDATRTAWCTAWQTEQDGGPKMTGRDRGALLSAAGGKQKVEAYCADVTDPSASPSASPAQAGKPSK